MITEIDACIASLGRRAGFYNMFYALTRFWRWKGLFLRWGKWLFTMEWTASCTKKRSVARNKTQHTRQITERHTFYSNRVTNTVPLSQFHSISAEMPFPFFVKLLQKRCLTHVLRTLLQLLWARRLGKCQNVFLIHLILLSYNIKPILPKWFARIRIWNAGNEII